MDLIRFLSPKHVILVHGEKPKMASLKGRIESEMGIQCYYPANNETVRIPSSQHVKATPSDIFIKSCQNPNIKFSITESQNNSTSKSEDTDTKKLHVTDERVTKGVMILQKNKKARVVHQDELPLIQGGSKHDIKFSYCFPLRHPNSNAPTADQASLILAQLSSRLSTELAGETNIKHEDNHLQAETFSASICVNNNCPYRTFEDNNVQETAFLCCNWSGSDDKLAWRIISLLENTDFI